MQERKRLEQSIADDQRIAAITSDLDTLFELAREGEDVNGDIAREMKSFSELLEKVETAMLLSGENDARSAIVTIHPGAGGTESQDWAEMLLRMYLRWAERNGFNTVITDRLEGEGAGIKSVTFEVNGENAYGLLQSEIGVHRLVRISPFDSATPGGTPPSRRSSSTRRWMTKSRSISSSTISVSTRFAPVAPAASTST